MYVERHAQQCREIAVALHHVEVTNDLRPGSFRPSRNRCVHSVTFMRRCIQSASLACGYPSSQYSTAIAVSISSTRNVCARTCIQTQPSPVTAITDTSDVSLNQHTQ